MVWREHLFILLKRRVRAGILLYALLMAGIFSLLLQFYLNRVVSMERQHQAQRFASQAYLIAELTKNLANENQSGHFKFDKGYSDYTVQDNQCHVTVTLSNQQTFDYTFQNTHKEKVD